MDNKRVKMVQHSKYRWTLESPKGVLLVDDLMLASPYKAEEWCKSYISSHSDWCYEIIPLKKEIK